MNPLRYFGIIFLIVYICLTFCVHGSKFGECGNILSDLNLEDGVNEIGLFLSTGRSCRCSDIGNSYWTVWSPCSPSGNCFEAKQHRIKKCRNGCFRIQLRRCRRKPFGCNGKWGSWSNDYACYSTTSSVTRTRFCYSKSGKLGSYCNNSRDEFFQTQRVPCGKYVASTPKNAPKGNSNNSSWITSSQGNLVIIILSVLAGIFLVALIFISIMFAALRKSILLNGGSKGRSVSESTVSAASCLTTVPDKEISSSGGSPKYHQFKATHFRSSSNAKDSPPVKVRNKESVLSKHKEKHDTIQSSAPVTESKRQHEEVKREIVDKEPSTTERMVTEDVSKERGLGLFKKAHSRRSDKAILKDAMVIAAIPAFDDVAVSQKTKKEYFQSLPHIRTNGVEYQKRKSKNSRFSGGKERTEDKQFRDRTKSEDEIVFSGWDKSNESAPTTPSSQVVLPEFKDTNDVPKKAKRPASNTFLFSSRAFNSLQKASTASRALPRNNGFKLDNNMLMKKAVAANVRGRGGFDDRQPNIAVSSHDDSGNYSHIDLDFRAYGSVLDAKPIDADAISNGSAYADVWDADYTAKPISDNDEDDYSEVFDAKSNAKKTSSTKALPRPTDLSNRSLPSIRSRNKPHEAPLRRSYHPAVSGALRSPTKDKELPTIGSEAQEGCFDEKFNEPANEPIYCAI